MGIVSVDDLRPGMVLASDLRTPQGRLVLEQGAELTQEHINTCKVWGILEADIHGSAPPSGQCTDFTNQSALVRRAAIRMTKFRFRFCGTEHPLLKELAKLHTFRTAETLDDDLAAEMILALEEAASQEPSPFVSPVAPLNRDNVLVKDMELSSLPAIFNRIIEAINNPRSSANYVAEVISSDPNLSARLLKLVNSPVYGFSQKVDKLSRAVTILGSTKLSRLALGVSVVSVFENVPRDMVDMKTFWRHSLTCSVLSKLIAGHSPRALDEERAFVAGLLHDCGRLLMLQHHPDFFLAAVEAAQIHKPMLETEKAVWGFDHAELAGRLLASWKLPSKLTDAVALHHAPASDTSLQEAAVVHVADLTSLALEPGSMQARPLPPFDESAWDVLDLTVSAFRPITSMVDRIVDETINVFFND